MAWDEKELKTRTRDFVGRHPHGWSHDQWLGLLAELRDAGVDTHDHEAIGAALEHERLLVVLESAGVKGLGPKRREALAARFGRLWDLRHASVEEIAALPSFHRGLAEAVHQSLR
jgi:excinuclease UvrABC nuclease subunit